MSAAVVVVLIGSWFGVVQRAEPAGAVGRPVGVSLVGTAATFAAPVDVASSPTGRFLMVLDGTTVRRVDLTDDSVQSFPLAGLFTRASHIAVDGQGDVYVSGMRHIVTIHAADGVDGEPADGPAAAAAGPVDNFGMIAVLRHDTGFTASVLTELTAAGAPIEIVDGRLVTAGRFPDRNGRYDHLVSVDTTSGAVRDLYRPEYAADAVAGSVITSIVADPQGGVIADIDGSVSEGKLAQAPTMWRYDGSLTAPRTVVGTPDAGFASPDWVRIAGHTTVTDLAAVPDGGMIVAAAGNVVRSFSSGIDPTHGYYDAGEWVGNRVDHPDRRLPDADGATLVLGRADLAAGAALGELSGVRGMVVGEDGTLYAADTGNRRVVAVTQRACTATGPGWCTTMTPFEVLIMGDSFSAGNGAGAYDAVPGGCLRSPNTWGQLATRQIGRELRRPVSVTNRACSGATTRALTKTTKLTKSPQLMSTGAPDETTARARLSARCKDTADVDRRLGAVTLTQGTVWSGYCTDVVAPQIESVSPSIDLVLMTLGGNDVGFSTIVENCLILITREHDECDEALRKAETATLPSPGSLRRALSEAVDLLEWRLNPMQRTPLLPAKVIVLGYPYLEFNPAYAVDEIGNPPLKGVGARVRALGDRGDAIMSAIEGERAGVEPACRLRFDNGTKRAFQGHEPHAPITTFAGSSWLLPVMPTEKGLTMHPNPAGHAAEADVAVGAFLDIRSCT